ncbi:hypothetical protein GF337_00555 [candidate division KSB1 bacterium]|nr:hypothetical protein [candidate division KSB1 bacterium]
MKIKLLPIHIVLLSLFILSCSHTAKNQKQERVADEDVKTTTRSAPMPWLDELPEKWQRDFSGSDRDTALSLPGGNFEDENIGKKTRVFGVFDRWKLNEDIRGNRGTQYAEITEECKGDIELDFALTPEEWAKEENRIDYYQRVEGLIEKIGDQLVADFGDSLVGTEKKLFIRALKTLAWQESQWQHYLRYKNRFFVIVSGGSYNKLDDWGITQLARSSFDPNVPLNQNFFESKGYCSISGSLYYGFMEYYYCYLEARSNPCNGRSLFNKIIGAYNRYSSGYSSCCFDLARHDEGYRNYQISAMGHFKDKFILQPWQEFTN